MTSRTLSVFIDESGDFGPYEKHAPYYLVAMVFHSQNTDISDDIRSFEEHLNNFGYRQHAVHTGPLIRRESVYSQDCTEERKHLFNALFHFTRRLGIHYICIKIKKSECPDVIALNSKLSKEIANNLRDHASYFSDFEQINVYYDNGQIELTKVLTSVFNALYTNVEFRKVKPVDYKLFQVADLICTMELLSEKADSASFSKSETAFFHSIRDFRKNYLKPLRQKLL